MTGRKITASTYARNYSTAKSLLELRKLSKKGQFTDVDLRLYPGEILGITGLIGSGRTELALALFGLNPPDSGQILIEGQGVPDRLGGQGRGPGHLLRAREPADPGACSWSTRSAGTSS